MCRKNIFLFLLPLFSLFSAGVRGASAPIPHGTVELISENDAIAPSHSFVVGLHFTMEKGWHIYWSNPGDSGQPPEVQWKLPPGISAGAIEWPVPERMQTSTIVDFGYHDAVLLMTPMKAGAALATGNAAQIGASLEVLVCREMCLPGKTRLSLALPVTAKATANPTTRELFAEARNSLPKRAPRDWAFTLRDAKDSLILTARVGRSVTQATFFPAIESQIDNAAPQKLAATATGFQMTLRKSDQLLKPVSTLKGVLVFSPGEAYTMEAASTRVPRGTAQPSSSPQQIE